MYSCSQAEPNWKRSILARASSNVRDSCFNQAEQRQYVSISWRRQECLACKETDQHCHGQVAALCVMMLASQASSRAPLPFHGYASKQLLPT